MALTRHSFEADQPKKKSRLKAALLAGTALVGVGLFPSMPRSATITYTNAENDTTDYTLTSSDTFQTAAGGSITATQSGLLNLAGFAATLDAMAATDQLTFSDVISGTGSVLINGSGTIILTAANTYSGGTTLTSGTLTLQGGSALADAGALTINGGILLLNTSEAIGTLSGTGGTVTLGSNTLTVNQSAAGTFAGTITGSGSLTKAGTATLTLSGTNTYTGGTTFGSGTLNLANSSGAGTGTITSTGGGTITLSANGGNYANQLDLTVGDLTVNTFVNVTYSGNINTSADASPHTLNVSLTNLGDSISFTGDISGSGSLSVNNSSVTGVSLSGTNTFSGGTTKAGAGSLTLIGGSALSDTGSLTINAGTVLLSASETVGTLSGSGGFINLSINTLSVNQSASGTFSGIIFGSGALVKNGTATLTLSGTNTYTGGTVIDGGTLRLLNSAGAGVGTITVNGSTLELGDGVTNANAIDMNADTTLATVAGGTETATQSGAIDTSADSSPHALTVNARDAADTLTVSGVISGSGSLVTAGSGTIILSATNTFTGNTSLAGSGTVVAFPGSGSSFGSGGVISFDNAGATLEYRGTEGFIGNAIDFNTIGAITTTSGGTDSGSFGGTIDLMANTMTANAVDAGDTLTFSGVISGSGDVVFSGAGTITLSATNTYTGNTSLAGSGTVVAAGFGGSVFGPSGVISFDNAAATLEKTGTEGFIGNAIDFNTAGAITTTSGGTDFGPFTGAFDLMTNTLTANAVDAADTLTFSGVISGSGDIIKTGTGTLILSGSNTYTGGTTIIDGTLALSNAAAAGTGTITFSDSGSNPILDLNNVTIANTISVPGGNAGIQIVVDNGDASGITGAIDLGADINGDVFFIIDAASTLTVSGNVSGSGTMFKIGSGTLVLSGTNTNSDFTSSLTIINGTVQLNSSTGAGSGSISFSGPGDEVLALSGGLTVTNEFNFFSSGNLTTLSGGTDASTLSGNFFGFSSATLTFNTFDAADSLTVSGVISETSGTTSLVKIGLGTLILSGTNTYTGDTTINGGTLFNNGSLTSDILIAIGGTYGGTGTLTGNISASGTVAPGTSIGTTTVTGTVTFNGGSNLAVEFDASGNSDLVDVTGSVTISSTSTVTATPLGGGFSGQLSYTIIDTTGGVTGTFDTLTFTDASFFGFLTHNTNTVVLTAGEIGSTFVENASTPNQSAIADALDGLDPNTNSDFGTIFNDFLTLGSAAQATALDQMSGEGLGTLTSSTLATNDLRTQGIASHLNDARLNRSEGTAARTSATRYAQAGGGGGASVHYGKGVLWMQGYGGKATMDAGGGSFDAAGIDIGYDTWLGDDLLIGVTVGVARDRETGFANLASAEAEYINFGGHMALDSEPVYFHGIFAVGIGDFTTTRNIVFGTTNRTAMGSFDGLNATFYGEVGFDNQAGDLTLQPYIALNYSYIERDGYTETGAGSLNLVVAKESVHSLQGILGVRAGTTWQAGDNMTIRPEIRARWVHELADGDMRRSMVNFVGSSASFATINEAAGFGDAFVFGTSFDISTGGSFHIVIGGDYLLSDEYDMWSGTGRVLWNF